VTAIINLDIKRGVVCREDAQVFPTRTGRPKLTFRLKVPRSRSLPKKTPVNADFFSVVAFGDRYIDLAPLLTAGQEVLVIGVTQSRDTKAGVVTELLAQHIIPFPTMPDFDGLLAKGQEEREKALVTLAWYLASEIDIARRQGGDNLGEWPVEDLSRWFVEKLRSQLETEPVEGGMDAATGD
jgi:hypothetical protein